VAKKKTTKNKKKTVTKKKKTAPKVKKKASVKKVVKKTVKKAVKKVKKVAAATVKKKKVVKAKKTVAAGKAGKTKKLAPQTNVTRIVVKKPLADKGASAKKNGVKKAVKKVYKPVINLKPVIPPLPTVDQLRKVKTGLAKRDLQRFRELLVKKHDEISGDVASLEIDARTKNSGGNLSNVPVHMADIGSDNYEQEFTLGLVESEQRMIREINEALQRMEQKIYGVCVERAIPIGRARLEAKPWAKYCIEVARKKERGGR